MLALSACCGMHSTVCIFMGAVFGQDDPFVCQLDMICEATSKVMAISSQVVLLSRSVKAVQRVVSAC